MEVKDFIINREGLADFYVHAIDENTIPSKSMVVFYNKKMMINRDITNLAITTYKGIYNQKNLIIVDSMAASGVSSIRILKECRNVKKIYINDLNPIAIKLIKKNIILNKLDKEKHKIEISRKDANFLLAEIAQYDCFQSEQENIKPNIISIDPFGTPNRYLDSAFKAIKKINGLLCVTATDTPVLFGIKQNACLRKYLSKPLHSEYCKEIGARILLYFISRIANINNMGIVPLLTFSYKHFIRIFALTFKNKKLINKFIKKFGYIIHCRYCGFRTTQKNQLFHILEKCPLCNTKNTLDYAGPLWLEEIHDKQFIKEILILNQKIGYKCKNRIDKLLNLALEEIDMPVTYYNIHKLSQNLKMPYIPKMDVIQNKIKEKGYKVSRTHFDFLSIKTNMDLKLIKEILLDIKI
ncbi:MAG: tRNA (guanine(10)-N(2))-dimethyltransferase [Candidatus Hodarchaeota archaeon]